MKVEKKIFIEKIQEILREKLGNEYEIENMEVRKNNGKLYTGITIRTENYNIAPTIYLDGFYEQYRREEKKLVEVAEEVLLIYEKNQVCRNYDVDEFLDYQKAKTRLIYELINYEENLELLERIPYIRFHDLAIVFRLLCTVTPQETGTIQITNEHVKIWNNVSAEELYQFATINTPKLLGCQIRKLTDVLKGLLEDFDETTLTEELTNAMPLFILSNDNNVKGAASLIYPNVLRDFSYACKKDIYILPSSVHEVLLLPVDEEYDEEMLKEMVTEINEKEVALEDRLSNHIYHYSYRAQQFSIVA